MYRSCYLYKGEKGDPRKGTQADDHGQRSWLSLQIGSRGPGQGALWIGVAEPPQSLGGDRAG